MISQGEKKWLFGGCNALEYRYSVWLEVTSKLKSTLRNIKDPAIPLEVSLNFNLWMAVESFFLYTSGDQWKQPALMYVCMYVFKFPFSFYSHQ